MNIKIIRWVTRVVALVVFCFGLAFYFGYENPLPFIDPQYTLYDNLWLSIFPIMFLGLAIGWWHEKLGGYMIIISLGAGLIMSTIIAQDFSINMLIPFIIGVAYLFLGYKGRNS
ncbi:MAG: hypothetical protein WC898_02850 [Candidatus Paceibacterota bacterium]|jgi:hypothetical protein